LLFIVTQEPFNPTKPEHLQSPRILAEALIAHAG
jgi:hypothetical protein